MSAPCGPSIPEHILAARKRKAEEEESSSRKSRSPSPDTDSKRARVAGPSLPAGPTLPAGPSPPIGPSRPSGPSLPAGPSVPHTSASPSSSRSSTPGPTLPTNPTASTAPHRPPAGPAPPPAPLSEMPSNPPGSDSDSDSDSDIGPSLPASTDNSEAAAQARLSRYAPSSSTSADSKPKRDEWMIVPPSSFDWASKVDPTKLKARKFATSKPGRSLPNSSGGVHDVWTETPEEKRKRLAEEVMGVRKPVQEDTQEKKGAARSSREDEETARRIREYNEKQRGKTLVESHRAGKKIEEDDPSKRAFDREKDIAGGVKIGERQKKEMLDRARNFGDRFSKGSFL